MVVCQHVSAERESIGLVIDVGSATQEGDGSERKGETIYFRELVQNSNSFNIGRDPKFVHPNTESMRSSALASHSFTQKAQREKWRTNHSDWDETPHPKKEKNTVDEDSV